jgi:hypothetical protein
MLIWRLRIPCADDHSAGHKEVVCHVQKRDAAYRLMMRLDRTLVVDEMYDSIFAAARRAEQLRQEARPPGSPSTTRVSAML